MELVDVGRGRLAATVNGPPDGPPVLLIAGGGADATTWVRLVPEVVADADERVRSEPVALSLAADHRVAVFDQAGSGASASVPPASSAAHYAADALCVGHALLGETFLVVGASLGGIAAQHLALSAPATALGLVLVATVTGASTFVPPTHDEPLPPDRRSFARHFPDAHPALFRHLSERQAAVLHHPDEALAQINVFLTHDAADELAGIRCPTVVIGGAEDRTFPVENSRLLAAGIPGARLVELERVGHAVHLEAPEAIAAAVRSLSGRRP